MTLPSNSKQAGDIGHVEDHNAIVDEITYVKNNYFSASSSNINLPDYLRQDSASTLYLSISSSNNFLLISSSSNFLQVSASSNFLPMGASSNFATVTISTNAQTETSYTLSASDSGKIIEMNNAAANLVIIPLNSTVPFPIGTQIEIVQTGAGSTSASIVSGVTLNSEAGKRTINAQWQGASLIKRGTDAWIMMGAIKA